MRSADLSGVVIAGAACAVPSFVDDLSGYRLGFGDSFVDKFSAVSGVKTRRVANDEQTASDLAYAAARYLLEREALDPREIGGCIFVTQTPDYRVPATAHVLQYRLGLPEDCVAFDVNLGCSGYVYGLNIAASIMKTNQTAYFLLLAGDTSNKFVSPEDRTSCMLFGEAGSATLLKLDDSGKMRGCFKSNGAGFKDIIVPSGAFRNMHGETERVEWGDGNRRSDYDLYMDGVGVFSFAVSEVPKLIKEYLSEMECTVESFDGFVFHQANSMILKQITKKLRISAEKVPVSLDCYGNTSVTSIPLTLCDAYGEREGAKRLLMCGFGVGQSWGLIDTAIDCAHVYPIIDSDDYFTEGGVARG